MAATVWKGYITFGLVSFPVRLYSAARAEPVHFHMVHRKDLSRVKEVWYCAEENKAIERSEIAKGYETAKGTYVTVDDADLKKIAPSTAAAMDVVQFVKDGDVDAIYFERSYYVGPGEGVTKPYALFLKALGDSGHSAIARLSMHGREHVVLIRAAEGGLVLHTLFYPNELHKANRQSSPKMTSSRKELDLATQLIHQLAGPFHPDQFHDTYRENVEKLIEQKRKGQKITATPKQRRAPVIDLMAALKKSLQSSAGGAGSRGSTSPGKVKRTKPRKAA